VVVGAPNGCARGCPTPEEEKEAEAREQPSGAPEVEKPAARIEAERRGKRAMPKGGTANGSGGTFSSSESDQSLLGQSLSERDLDQVNWHVYYPAIPYCWRRDPALGTTVLYCSLKARCLMHDLTH
jgi:hypothetical protein